MVINHQVILLSFIQFKYWLCMEITHKWIYSKMSFTKTLTFKLIWSLEKKEENIIFNLTLLVSVLHMLLYRFVFLFFFLVCNFLFLNLLEGVEEEFGHFFFFRMITPRAEIHAFSPSRALQISSQGILLLYGSVFLSVCSGKKIAAVVSYRFAHYFILVIAAS